MHNELQHNIPTKNKITYIDTYYIILVAKESDKMKRDIIIVANCIHVILFLLANK